MYYNYVNDVAIQYCIIYIIQLQSNSKKTFMQPCIHSPEVKNKKSWDIKINSQSHTRSSHRCNSSWRAHTALYSSIVHTPGSTIIRNLEARIMLLSRSTFSCFKPVSLTFTSRVRLVSENSWICTMVVWVCHALDEWADLWDHVITVHELFRRWILYIFWGIRLDMMKKILYPKKQPFDAGWKEHIYK